MAHGTWTGLLSLQLTGQIKPISRHLGVNWVILDLISGFWWGEAFSKEVLLPIYKNWYLQVLPTCKGTLLCW